MSFLNRIPARWRSIGWVHMLGATAIITSLKVLQSRHEAESDAFHINQAKIRREERQAEREAEAEEAERAKQNANKTQATQ